MDQMNANIELMLHETMTLSYINTPESVEWSDNNSGNNGDNGEMLFSAKFCNSHSIHTQDEDANFDEGEFSQVENVANPVEALKHFGNISEVNFNR